MSTRIAALSTVLALFLGGCTNNHSEYNLNNKFSDDKSSQSSSSFSEESDDTQKMLDEKNRTSVYGVLSGNPNEYHFAYNTNNTKKISDKDVEAKVGLTGEEIKELTHTFNGEYDYLKARFIRDYLDKLPSLDKSELAWLLKEDVDRQFIDYAITIGYTSFDDVMLLKEVFEANGATTQQVGAFTVELDAPPLPDELVDAHRRLNGSNGYLFNELFSKGYPLDEIVALAQIHVTGSTFNHFEAIGLVDVHTIEKLVLTYGLDVAKTAKTMNEAGLSVMDLPLVERVGAYDLEKYVNAGIKGREDIARLSEHVNGKDANLYALAGFKGDADSMLFLDDNNVSGGLAFVYSRKGFTDKRAMVFLEKAGVDESAFVNMLQLGFLDNNRYDLRLGEVLVANSVYQQYKPLLEQALPDGVGLHVGFKR